jgi:hypothetical protein
MFDIGRLAAIDPADHGKLVLTLHPALRLRSSPYPLLQIWRINQPEYVGEMDVDWDQAHEYLLVRRDLDKYGAMGVAIQAISAGASRFLRALQDRCTLETVAALALEAEVAFNLQDFLLECVQSGVIIDFESA